MKKVIKCKKSTISEAWGIVVGMPKPFKSEETDLFNNALIHSARQNYKNLELVKDAQLRSYPKEGLVAAHWVRQVVWPKNKSSQYLVRLGHNYFSMHFLADPVEYRYKNFNQEIKKDLQTWLSLYDSCDTSKASTKLQSIGFGYTNKFNLPSKNFRMSDYLNLDVVFTPEFATPGVSQIETSFKYADKANNVNIHIRVNIDTKSGAKDELSLATTIYGLRNVKGLSFSSRVKILKEIADIKMIVKNTFFNSFVTSKTADEIMEAVYG